jgi:predicted nucleic acid-binding Zn ribbon protein
MTHRCEKCGRPIEDPDKRVCSDACAAALLDMVQVEMEDTQMFGSDGE